MKKIEELKRVIAPLINSWYIISDKYSVGEKYWYKRIGNNVIEIEMKRYEKNGVISIKFMDRIFNSLINSLNADVIITPYSDELWYEWGLEWLFHHYRYGEWNFSNCALVTWDGRVLAVSYNWCKEWRMIKINSPIIPDYIVYNNNKKIKWEYYYRQLTSLKDVFEALLNK